MSYIELEPNDVSIVINTTLDATSYNISVFKNESKIECTNSYFSESLSNNRYVKAMEYEELDIRLLVYSEQVPFAGAEYYNYIIPINKWRIVIFAEPLHKKKGSLKELQEDGSIEKFILPNKIYKIKNDKCGCYFDDFNIVFHAFEP